MKYYQNNELHLYIFRLYHNDLLLFHHQSLFHISSRCYLIENFHVFVSFHFQLKCFFHYFFTVTKLFMHHLSKITSCIFLAVKNNWLAEFIISTDKFTSKAARNVILIIFCIRTTCFSSLLTIFKIHSKSAIDFKWCW